MPTREYRYKITFVSAANLTYQVFFRTLEDEKACIDHGAAKAVVDFAPDMTPTSLVAKVVRDLKRSGHIKVLFSFFLKSFS